MTAGKYSCDASELPAHTLRVFSPLLNTCSPLSQLEAFGTCDADKVHVLPSIKSTTVKCYKADECPRVPQLGELTAGGVLTAAGP